MTTTDLMRLPQALARQSPLHRQHLSCRASLAESALGLMPARYGDLATDTAQADQLGLVDLCLMPRAGFKGAGAGHFLQQYSAGQDVSFSAGALLKLSEHQWPGNVRELENVVQRTLILRNGLVIDEDVIAFETSSGDPEGAAATKAAPVAVPVPALDSGLKAREQAMILDALKAERGSRKDTAERLGISPRTLRYKLARFKEMGIALPA